MKKYILALILIVYSCTLHANMIPIGDGFVGNAEIPDDRVTQFMYDNGGTFQDFTNTAQNHLTDGGSWKGEALIEAGVPKDGFVNGDVVYVFIDYEQAMRTQGGSVPLTFEFANGDTSPQADGHITSLTALPVSNFTATALKNGRIQLDYNISSSSFAGKYNIYYDGLSIGTIDYDNVYASVTHPGNSIILGPFVSGVNYKFGIRVENQSGKEESNTDIIASAIADSVFPEINITAPTAYELITGEYEIVGTIADATINFSYYSVYYGVGANPSSWNPIVQNVNPGVVAGTIASFDTTLVSDGLYTINVYAIDTVQNENIQNVLVYVDNDINKITSPQPSETVFDNVTIIGTADDVLFKEYYLYLGEGENPSVWQLLKTSTTSVSDGTLGSFDSTLYSGTYKLKLQVYNTNNVISYVELVQINIDNKTPYIEITGLPNWSYTKDNFVNITGKTVPGSTLTINATSVPVSSLNGGFTRFTALVEGVNGFSFESTSVNGLVKKLDYYLIKDTVSPVITSISPINNYVSSSPVLTVSGIVEIGSNLSVNGVPISVNSVGNFTHELALVTGSNSYAFKLEDKAKNSTYENRTYTFTLPGVDSIPPEFVDYYSIENKYFNTTTPVLKFHIVDEKSGINSNSIIVTIDGKTETITKVNKDANYNIEVSLTPSLSNGNHSMIVKCKDYLGSELSKTVNFTVDTNKPYIEYSIKPDTDDNYINITAMIVDENTAYPSTLSAKIWLIDSDQSFSESLPYSVIDLVLQDESVSTYKRYFRKYDVGFGFSGQVIVKVLYEDSAGNVSENLGVFAKRIFLGESDISMSTADGGALFIIKGALALDEMIFYYVNDFSDKTFYSERSADFSSRNLKFIYPSYEIKVNGYSEYNFFNNAYITVVLSYIDKNSDSLEDYTLYSEDDLEVYYWDDNLKKYIFVYSFHDSVNNTFTFNTNHLSEFIILGDLENPTITELSLDKEKYITRPRFVFKVEDFGSGVNWDNFDVYFNAQKNTYTYDTAEGLLIIKPDSDLADDSLHKLSVTIYDFAGKSSSVEKQFSVGLEYTISEYIAYPSPADTFVKFRYFITSDAYQVQLKIYNESGRLVKVLEGDTESDYNEILWTLTDGDLNNVVNGTYFYKLIAKFSDSQVEKRGKVMVMR
ncbi:hypothetical protein KAJ27_04810 [bacterium]|nr:hypothetical protein [bacterium]